MIKKIIYAFLYFSFIASSMHAQVTSKNKVDANAKKFINKADKFTANAVYLQISDIINGGIAVGVQRKITNRFLADASIAFGIKSIDMDINSGIGFARVIRHLKYKEKSLFGRSEEIEMAKIKTKFGANIALHYCIAGNAPKNAAGYILLLRRYAYDFEYQNLPVVTNTFSTTSVMPGFFYKVNITSNFGYDILVAGGLTSLSFGTSTDTKSVFNNYKHTKLDGLVQLKLFYTF